MWRHTVFLLVALVTGSGYCDGVSFSPSLDPRLAAGEKKLSDQLRLVLEHFKHPDPVGMPGAEIPDPYSVPDMKQSLSFATVYFKNAAVYGISKFRIIYIKADIGAMEVQAQMVIDALQTRGNYTMSTWLNRAQGPFTVDITGLKVTARANLGVERDGKLRAQDINIDLGTSSIKVDFQNLGLFGSMFQGVINSIGNVIFDSIKPYILKEAYGKARDEINNKLEEVAGDMQFPNSISPLDMVIADLRKKVQAMGMDPFHLEDHNKTVNLFTVTLSNSWIMGISSFQRVGNITLKMENNTMIADFEIGTQKIEGITQWEISTIGNFMSRAGTASFSAEYINGRFVLAQPLDTREKPQFRSLDLELGNIQVRCDGAGTLDYVIEAVVNILPNLLRYQIMDAIENPVKQMVQQELDEINVEDIILEQLPSVDNIEKTGFKLSALKDSTVAEEPYDEDQFFDF